MDLNNFNLKNNFNLEIIMTIEDIEARIKELNSQMTGLEVALKELHKIRKKSIQPKMRFTLIPKKPSPFEYSLDPMVTFCALIGECINKEEYVEAGNEVTFLEGSATYLFNHFTNKIITNLGGGTLYLPINTVSDEEKAENIKILEKLGDFLRKNINGGEVTYILKSHPRFRWS